MKKKILVALGGNALGTTPKEMKVIVKKTVFQLAKLIKKGFQLIICHGNGPQVGIINNMLFEANIYDESTSKYPLSVCNSMSQAYISHYLLNALNNELVKNKIKKEVVTLMTYTIVDKNDSAFKNPNKQIGNYYRTLNEAKKILGTSAIVKQFKKGFRQIVPSPKPISFLGIESVEKLINSGSTVIFGGGGGVPIFKNKKNEFEFLEGIVDKDYSASKIAQLTKVDSFIILTNVKGVYINYGTKQQKMLNKISTSEIDKLLKDNAFGEGTMKPKIQAAYEFVNKTKKTTIIGDINDIEKILLNKAGTRIIK
jgi:carbamate kinase